MGKVTLTYWPLRGLCTPIQWIMEYGGIEYEINRMTSFEQWTKEKPNLPLDFPNLPHIAEGNVRMSESTAICKYLARKCDLMPKTDQEIINCDIAEGAINDFKMLFFKLMFNPNYETDKAKYPDSIKAKLALFEKVFAKRPWLAGDNITWLDFVLYESLDVNSMFVPGILDEFPKVVAYKTKIDNLEKIAAYRKSDRFNAWPVTGGAARWGTYDCARDATINT